MLVRFLRAGVLVAMGLALSGHTPGSIGGSEEVDLQPRMYVQEINPWTNLEWNDDPANFQFAIVSDRTGGHRKGIFEDAVGKLNLGLMMVKRQRIIGSVLRALPVEQKSDITARFARRVLPHIEAGRIVPLIHEVLPLEEAARAHAMMEASGHFGKIVLRLGAG